MSDPFVGEIRMFAGNYAPRNWAFCDGQLLSITQNEMLFALIGTTYGGDGRITFALPDLRGRIPLHMGTSASGTLYHLGQKGGAESVTLTPAQLPAHAHGALARSAQGGESAPTGAIWAASTAAPYSTDTPTTAMAAGAVQQTGGGRPHDNMMPFTAVSFIIALFGIYPSRD